MTEDDIRRIVMSMKSCLDPSHIACEKCCPVPAKPICHCASPCHGPQVTTCIQYNYPPTLCEGCPPIGYLADMDRCAPCPRRSSVTGTSSPCHIGETKP